MSADNRLIIYQAPDNKFYVWEGSCSFNYFEPPPNARVFDTEDEATTFALCEESKMCICEGGVQRLTNAEIIQGMREELEMLRDPGYCPECNACGIDACCSGAKCKKNAHNKCLYGETYALDYEYNDQLASKLYDALCDYDPELAGQIMGEVRNQIYNSTLDTSKSLS